MQSSYCYIICYVRDAWFSFQHYLGFVARGNTKSCKNGVWLHTLMCAHFDVCSISVGSYSNGCEVGAHHFVADVAERVCHLTHDADFRIETGYTDNSNDNS